MGCTFYTAHVLTNDGAIAIPDIDVEIEWSVADGPEVQIDGVYIDLLRFDARARKHAWEGREDLLKSRDPLLHSIGIHILDQVEDDADWLSDRLEEAGFVYRSRGGTDPEAQWVAA